ncbi:MAG: YHS domain-containing (seleno)protein [Arenicellales bacterium]|nr:YHS domain-containing (seleno)protein [Arenicellales bacterium]
MLKKPPNTFKRFFINLSLVAGLVTLSFAGDPQKMVATGSGGVAIKGYDTVAYFTENQAIKGSPEFVHSWRDAKWHFVNAEHRDLFAADPERYAPQFGGFCALGISKGKAVAADPEAWTIVDGKLYMKFNEDARDRWRKDKERAIEKAKENWVELQKQE